MKAKTNNKVLSHRAGVFSGYKATAILEQMSQQYERKEVLPKRHGEFVAVKRRTIGGDVIVVK